MCTVAQYLLVHGLRGKEGVVFLDEQDRRMVLVRSSMKVMPLQNSGIPESERFVFYDQVRVCLIVRSLDRYSVCCAVWTVCSTVRLVLLIYRPV